MTLLDGQIAKPTWLDRIANFRLLVIFTVTMFALCVLTSPLLVYISFAYFTAKEGPWWLDPATYIWVLSFTLSTFILLLLGVVTYMQARQD
jgi:hypothetical protein